LAKYLGALILIDDLRVQWPKISKIGTVESSV